ncbi:alpha-(1-_6)-mannopyranosyltransferase A [Gordonia sp. zg691]|uniref:Alpha-(1->6)-mannopyranosyltransferase A n=1 Tax=Gordonia jinghuaiqii TaxID=2758710 RepID=A0A7D7LPK0_9ACTN|nr:alpha-(1->6)-mannopyranosyltransferase A [Gordonia jinghuaiqii]MBD0860073.1 alpha-(1->6)-mannopyranosyltransferase A [Gordonia jinghuaiqii]MCR5977240.1 alpha-(1->6)-mannopyranosyltransferase A [Gordonia jinghuaiqii]QMT00165.1 alpha-(1->6)-mannopyranosyltransferase A [Gordonia jinghuaiqii]
MKRSPVAGRVGPATRDLICGAIGAALVCVGSFGVGDPPRNSPLLTDLGLSWITYGHGKNLFGTFFWTGVFLMVFAWVRLGRRVVRPTTDADTAAEALPSTRTLGRWVLVWTAPLLIAVPVYSRDVYAYLAQGAVFGAGFDPYADGPAHAPGPLVDSMAQVWATTTAPYGPFFMGMLRVVTEITGDHVILGVLAIRLLLLPGLFLSLWAIPRLARRFGASPQAGLWLTLFNPLVLIHLVAGPHVELLMMGVLVSGIALVAQRRHVLGTSVLAVAVSIKITAGVALPFVLWMWLAHIRSERQVTARDVVTVFASIVGIALAVFGFWTLVVGLGIGWLTGLGWADVIINWFTIPTLAAHLVTLVAAPFVALNLQPVLEVTRSIGFVVLAVTLVVLWWRHRHDDRDAVAGMAWAMLAVLLLEPSTLPWYYTWVLAIAVAFTLPQWARATVVGASTFLLIVFQPDDAIVFYKPFEVALAAALAGLAAWSLVRPDPLSLRRFGRWAWGTAPTSETDPSETGPSVADRVRKPEPAPGG